MESLDALEPLGWPVAAVLLVLVILRDAARDLVKRLAAAGVAALERYFSGSRWVRARALRRYQQGVAERLATAPVPFHLPGAIPLRNLYIPLRASDKPEATASHGQVDLDTALAERRRVLILGAPGSGKSLFLQFLHWASCDHTATADGGHRPLAVPVALNDLATSRDVVAEIVRSFDRYGFANAERFVRRELRRDEPNLQVLFDGLDEVASGERATVAGLVRDFATDHPSVPVVVTCRTQVYDGSLARVLDNIFHIQPFTDEMVERFLHAWPATGSRGDVDRLVNALWHTPRVALMVRNPLLLTLLAYLYTEEYEKQTALLPHNRAHFYRDASALLLRKWRSELNRYRGEQKRVVLQHLALVNQDSQADRRGIDYEVVLNEIRTALPRVGIERGEAHDVLDEIVERSGMLLRLDDRQRYQFAHITMQEYFAAVELLDRPDEILRRYFADRDAWREPIKLWCGVRDQDSTHLIRSLHDEGDEADKVLALECLADATRVDPSYAQTLIQWAEQRFSRAAPDDPIVRALGILASDSRPRGVATLQRLRDIAESPDSEIEDRRRAAAALAATNLPKAADAVAQMATEDGEIIPYVVEMGNVAVPALEKELRHQIARMHVNRGKIERYPLRHVLPAIDCLIAIGTPRAAQVLVPQLWREPPALKRRAALALAQLSSSPAVEDALAVAALPAFAAGDEDSDVTFDWVWQPFAGDRPAEERRQLLRIFGRCLVLLHGVTEEDLETVKRELDPRLVIAVLFFHHRGEPRRPGGRVTATRDHEGTLSFEMASSRDHAEPHPTPGTRTAPASQVEGPLHRSNPWHMLALELGGNGHLAAGLPPSLMWRLLPGVAFDGSRSPSAGPSRVREVATATLTLPHRHDWLTINEKRPAFTFDGSLHHRLPVVVVLLVAFACVPFAVVDLWRSSGWAQVGYGLAAGSLLTGCLLTLMRMGRGWISSPWGRGKDALDLLGFSPWTGAGVIWKVREGGHGAGGWRDRLGGFLAGVGIFGFTPSWLYGLVVWLHPPGWQWATTAAAVFTVLVAVPVLVGLRKQSQGNPLQGLFGKPPDRVEETRRRATPR